MILKAHQDWGAMPLRDGTSLLWLRLSCTHVMEFHKAWVSAEGSLSRIQCTEPGCRKIFDSIELEGWKS